MHVSLRRERKEKKKQTVHLTEKGKGRTEALSRIQLAMMGVGEANYKVNNLL